LSVLGKAFGDTVQTSQNVDEYFRSFEPSIPYLQKFAGKNILVTGASGGIGS
jgi:FlaA1/EpsC-like NDP-sugar epimerase